MNYYISTNKITIIDIKSSDPKPITFDASHPDFERVKAALLASDFEKAQEIVDNPTPTHEFNYGGSTITIENDEILYNGKPLNHGFVTRLKELREEGLRDATPWLRFLERVMRNPSQRIRDTLHTFVEDKHMALTEEGKILAYKGVREDLYDIYSGTIRNDVGATIEVERGSVDDNPEHTCSNGLHIGDYEYASSWGSNGKLLLVEFDPADAVSVPIDGQKLRTCKYKVIKVIDHHKPLNKPLYQVDADNDIHPLSNHHPSYQRAKSWLNGYMNDYDHRHLLTVESICDKFSGLSRQDVGRLTAECDAVLTWDDEVNDYVISSKW